MKGRDFGILGGRVWVLAPGIHFGLWAWQYTVTQAPFDPMHFDGSALTSVRLQATVN